MRLNIWRPDLAERPSGFGLKFERTVWTHYRLNKIDYSSEFTSSEFFFGDAVEIEGENLPKTGVGFKVSPLIWKRPTLKPPIVPIPPRTNPELLDKGEIATTYLPLDDSNKAILGLVKLRPGIGKQYARNAIRHMNLAVKLLDHDIDMAWVRAYHAREEAAKAIHMALVRARYTHATKFKTKDHIHMLAISSFFRVLTKWFYDYVRAELLPNPADGPFILYNTKTMEWELKVRLPGMPRKYFIHPVPPLNFSIRSDADEPFMQKLANSLASQKNFESFEAYIKDDFILRNHLLYASEKGIGS